MAYLPLSTANLPDPVIDPAQGSSPEDYFDVDIYTGTGASHERSEFTFQPDFVWFKGRNVAYGHQLFDSVRGANERLSSNVTNAEFTDTDALMSFDSDGFTMGTEDGINQSTKTYVAWAWKANGSGVSNTDGSITSTVSANTTSGFSIVSYAGNSTAGATIGHGLDSAPEMVIVKARDKTENWLVYHKGVASDAETDYLQLDTTASAADNSVVWNDTAPSSTVFTVGADSGVNGSTYNYIAYCFHSVEGFSKFGSYTGNGSADGSFVFCGFRPAFILVKRTNAVEDWFMYDDKRSASGGFNVLGERLKPNTSDSGYTTAYVDFVSNGFKWRVSGTGQNGSGDSYIFMAFSANPFKYSTAY